LAGVFWRILTIEMILLVWSVAYRMIAQDANGEDLFWYALRIICLVIIILVFMMLTLRRFLGKKIIHPLEAVSEANRRLDVSRPQVDDVPLDDDAALEIREIVFTRARMLQAILNVSNQRLQLVKFIRETFGRYMSRKIVDEILQSPEGRRIGGRRQTVTVLMSDLRGFSDLSDSRDPEEMVGILNRYLEAMTRVIECYDGVIDEFIGDAILTVFGIPEEKPDDPARAVACALAMQNELTDLNKELVRDRLPPLEMGIGINTGPVVVGNMGSEARTKYGIVGAVVNIASRIESNTIGGQILVGEATFEQVRDTVSADPPLIVMMKGLKRPVVCYSITDIGPPYAVSMTTRNRTESVEIQLPFLLWRLEGKRVASDSIAGETRLLGPSRLSVQIPVRLEPLTNVKLLFTVCREAHCFSDIYAKVSDIDDSRGLLLHHLDITYMNQADRNLLNRWTDVSEPYGEEFIWP
jgi:class 3 adenylate cyclase